MASILKSRVIQMSSSRFALGLDSQIVEGFLVGGIVPTANPFIQVRDCPGMPQVGDFHPDDTRLSMQLLEPKAFKNSKTQMWAMATYRPSDLDPINAPVVRFRATTVPVLRCYDANGN